MPCRATQDGWVMVASSDKTWSTGEGNGKLLEYLSIYVCLLSLPSPVDYVVSELSTMTWLSWVALHGMAHSFIELDKAMIHVISLPTKVHLVKAMVFSVVMYGCECWTAKKAEQRRIDAFELWCWRRLLGVPWTARRSSESILKEISPEYSLEGLMLKLKLQYFGHLM